MFFEIIGSLMVVVASGFIGFVFSKECSIRPQQLRVLQGLFQMFETEISYLSNVISHAFEKISKSSDNEVMLFFKDTVRKLEKHRGINACEAWESAVKENIKNTSLNKEDENILLSFGKMLGNSDLEGQIKNIRLTLNQLRLQEQKAEENKKRNETMYRSLGILGGAAIVIILI